MQRVYELVVGVDGSRGSDAAVAWGAREARSRSCELTVVYVCEVGGFWAATATLRAGLRELVRPVVVEAEELAARVAPGVSVRGEVLIGSPSRTLLRMSARTSLVVVGRTGRGSLTERAFGSLPQRLMANARCPVVAVSGRADTRRPDAMTAVVLAVADPDRQAQSAEFALSTAQRRGVPLRIVHADDADNRRPSGDPAARLSDLAADLERKDARVRVTAVLRRGSVVDVVGSECGADDLLVLARGRAEPFVPHSLGRHASALISASVCPVAMIQEEPQGRVPVAVDATAASSDPS